MANQQHTLVMVQPNHPTFIHTLPLPPIPPVVVPMQNYPPFWWNYAYRILQYAVSLFPTNFCNEKWIKCIKEYKNIKGGCYVLSSIAWIGVYYTFWFNSIYCLYFFFFLFHYQFVRDLFVREKKCGKIQPWVWWQCSSKIFVVSVNDIINIETFV